MLATFYLYSILAGIDYRWLSQLQLGRRLGFFRGIAACHELQRDWPALKKDTCKLIGGSGILVAFSRRESGQNISG